MKKKIISILAAMLMVLSLVPVGVFAVEIDGCDLTITATDGLTELVKDTDYKFSSKQLTVCTTTPVTIAMKEGVQSTSDRITIDVKGNANVTLNNVTITDTKSYALQATRNGSNVQLNLLGTNTLNSSDNYAVYANNKGDFTIGGTGTLNVSQTDSTGKFAALNVGSNVTATTFSETVTVNVTNKNPNQYGINIETGDFTVAAGATVNVSDITGKYAVYLNKAAAKISGKVNIENCNTGIYSNYSNAGCILLDGDARVKIKGTSSDAGDAIYTKYKSVTISDGALLKVENIKNGINLRYSSSDDTPSIEIKNSAELELNVTGYGVYTHTSGAPITISGQPKINIICGASGLYGGEVTISGGTIDITSNASSATTTYASIHAYKGNVLINDKAIVTLRSSTRNTLYSSNGSVLISGQAQVTATNTNEDGCGINCKSQDHVIAISEKAEVLVTAANNVFFSTLGAESKFQVVPASESAYEVTLGETAETAETVTYYNASEPNPVTAKYFYAKSKAVYAIPTITVDYLNGTLGGFDAAGSYTINGEDVTLNGTTFAINDSWYGTDIVIVRKGDDNAAASMAQTLTLVSKPAAVGDAVTKIDETIEGKGDGIISGITEEMEYKINDGEWIAGDGEDLNDLAAGTSVMVRTKATDVAPYGEETVYIISTGGKLTVVVPSGEGYIVSYEDSILVSYNGTFRFKVTLLDGYEAAKDFAITVNGDALIPDQDGIYTISEIVADQVILVNGIKKTSIPVVFVPRLENFATTTGQFNEQAYYCRDARAGDVVLLKVSTSELGDKYGLNYKNLKVVYEVEGAVQLGGNYDYNGNPVYKDGIATQFMLQKGMNKMVAKVYYNGQYVGAFEPFYTYIA